MRVLFIIISIALLSCTGNTNRENTATTKDTVVSGKSNDMQDKKDDKPRKPGAHNIAGCYWQLLERDTLVTSLSQNGNEVTGKLTFDNFEKDGSSGPVAGKIENGIIKLWYRFESEGMQSVMQVWLQQQGDILVRGTGAMDVRGDSSYFINPSEIAFTGNQQMKRINCSEVPSKYR